MSPDEHYLTGIRLIFTNGFQTPMLETATARPKIVWPLIFEDHFKPEGPKVEGTSVQVEQDYEIIDIDSTKVVRKVSVLIEERSGYALRGDKFVVKAIKMQSDDGEMLCTEHWCAQSGGRWHTQEIPNGLEIIGL